MIHLGFRRLKCLRLMREAQSTKRQAMAIVPLGFTSA
jgi:hypothetical protein